MRERTRVVTCAYCGLVRTVASARGPAPSYCSPAHRQAAYRERHAIERPSRARQATYAELVAAARRSEVLELALIEASAKPSWGAARAVLGEVLPAGEISTRSSTLTSRATGIREGNSTDE